MASSRFSKISFTYCYRLSLLDKIWVRAFSTTFRISFCEITQFKVNINEIKNSGQDYRRTFSNGSYDLLVLTIIPNVMINPVPRVSKTWKIVLFVADMIVWMMNKIWL